MFLGLLLSVCVVACIPQVAVAAPGDPVIVPQWTVKGYPDDMAPCGDFVPQIASGGWSTCLLPDHDATVPWPAKDIPPRIWGDNKNFILPRAGLTALWLGESRTVTGYPLIWRDVGSGFPVAPSSGPYEFPLAGKYFWECDSPENCVGQSYFKLKGTMYVIGPRAMITHKLISPDNSGNSITYGFDASASFVTDYQPWNIVQYAFDFEDDGVYDQVSPEPTAQHTFAPGPHTVRVKVTDNHRNDLDQADPRTAEYPYFFEIPYIRPGAPDSPAVPDTGFGGAPTTGVKFSDAKVRLKAVKKIRISVLTKRGLVVKISGLTKEDRINAKLLNGKKVVAVGTGSAAGSTKTVRLRVGRSGKRILKSKPKKKRLVLNVAVSGSDGFEVTKRAAVRVSP